LENQKKNIAMDATYMFGHNACRYSTTLWVAASINQGHLTRQVWHERFLARLKNILHGRMTIKFQNFH
jgi:hypothetical protein